MVWLKRESLSLKVPEDRHTEVGRLPAETARLPGSADDWEYQATAPSAGSSSVISRIQRLIEQGIFPPGSKLPPERALAAQLGVGRPAVREAIKALCVLEMLVSRRGSGTYVKSSAKLGAWGGILPDPADTKFGVLELLEVRKILETRAAWLAATRASEQHLLDIEAARERLEEHENDWRIVAKLDYELHSAIIRGAENPVLNLIDEYLMSHIFSNRNVSKRFTPDVERMRRDHKAIVESIVNRQADAAERAMVEHLNALGLDFIYGARR